MYKQHLQELAQRSCFNLPSYSTCIREGPEHGPRFKATVNFNGETFESPNYCSTLRQAQQAAAEVALNSLSNRGPTHDNRILATFGTFHQHALAQVTAQAPQAHSQMQNQAEFPSSVLSAPPASLLPRLPSFAPSTVETEQQITNTMPDPSIIRESSDLSHSVQRSQLSFIVKNRSEDGYNWLECGMMPFSGRGRRSYYKCAYPKCPACKKVHISRDGQITETRCREPHNHPPPQPSRLVKYSGNLNRNLNHQGRAELTKEGHTGNLNKSEGAPAYSLSLKDQDSSQVTPEHMSGEPDEREKVNDSENIVVDGRDEDESETEKSSDLTPAGVAMDDKTAAGDDAKMSMVISSRRKEPHGWKILGPTIPSADKKWIIEEVDGFRSIARYWNRRKDFLNLLMSFPIKLEGVEVDFPLLLDNFIKLNWMIEKLLHAISEEEMAEVTNLGELMDNTRVVLEDFIFCVAKYDDDINLYFDKYIHQYAPLEEHYKCVIDSVIRQILKCLECGQIKVISVYGAHAEEVTRALERLWEIRNMFQVVIRVSVIRDHTISEIRNRIAEKIHRLVGTDISLPLEASLKPYKFLLLLHCACLRRDLHDLKIPEHGSLVLASSERYDLNMMPTENGKLVNVEIRMEDHLLPWVLFWNNVSCRSLEIKELGNQLIEACESHLLAIILLARALKSEYDVGVWKLALQELQSLPKSSSAVGVINEVMVCALKFIWERKGIVTKHCIKQCISATEDGEVNICSLVACWLENDLVKSEEEGYVVVGNLIESFLLHKVGKDCVRMQRETRDVLLSWFIPRLHPLYLMQEGLGLSKASKVDEWDAKEINLSNNHLSELPQKPNCHSLEKLFLQKNRNLMLIPPSFFECMSRLLILDLSYTSIQSFPTSVTELVCLQQLLLKGCELFTELPSEIGLLQTLEVLDLEGTEIMYLPGELLKAQQLTCFKVSLYGYGECYRESKQISKRIPKGLFAGFNWLEALSIDVNPDDEEWVADVKDVVYELLKLKRLTTLKLYLPEVELLKEIASVQNFKFIVGHHKQRIVSCLPHEVTEEFEKQENYLKYINGKCIPTEVQNTLSRTGAFFLERHWAVKKLSEFGNKNLVKLKFCLLVECNELQTIIDGEESNKYESAVDRKPVLELLEYLGVHCMMSLRSIWEGHVGKGSLSKLKYLALHDCPNLSTIFSLSLLGNLFNLEELIVEDCPEIKSLLSQESSSSESSQFLPSLKKISLLDLPELVSISSGFCIAPKLERIIIYACPMLEGLSPAELSSDCLEVIKGEIEWWNSLKWNEYEWSSTQLEHMASVFVALKRDESLMDQLARS